jgi:Methyltransferase domain
MERILVLDPIRIAHPHAWIGHIPFAMWLVQTHRPSITVELGVHTGNSFFAMCQAAASNNFHTKCHGIDTWEGDKHAGNYDDSIWQDVKNYADRTYPDIAVLHRCFFDDAVSIFKDKTIDILHIDGLHTYEAVRHDFEAWQPKLSERAIVLFHDISEYRDDFGVHIFWKELCTKYNNVSFTHSHGLGVLFYGADSNYVYKSIQESKEIVNLLIPSSTNAFRLKGDLICFEYAQQAVQDDKENSLAQIRYRDALTAELKGQLSAVARNSNEQISYRDGLVAQLSQQLLDVKDNANLQIHHRDALVAELTMKCDAVEKNSTDQILYRDALVAQLTQQLADVDKNANSQIAYRDSQIADRDAQVVQLTQRLVKAQKILSTTKLLLVQLIRTLLGRKIDL